MRSGSSGAHLEISADLPCHVCGYDLRAHPADGRCPECGASVAEARRWAGIPRRPRWRDSDPRWRRRILAGTWILVLVPLIEVLKALNWAGSLPVPTIFDYRGVVRTLDDTLLANPSVYGPLVFCIGIVLLFSKERGRRRGRVDWTRRWGVLSSYVVLLLNAAGVLFIGALVLAGISAIFHSMPLAYQPQLTPWFGSLSAAWLRYGPQPSELALGVLVGFSSIVVLLACAPLFDAIRSSGPRWLAMMLLAPLAFFALMHLSLAARYCLGLFNVTSTDVVPYQIYFSPRLFAQDMADLLVGRRDVLALVRNTSIVEPVKWSAVLGIAVWLTFAQIAAWWQRTRPASRSEGADQIGIRAGEACA